MSVCRAVSGFLLVDSVSQRVYFLTSSVLVLLFESFNLNLLVREWEASSLHTFTLKSQFPRK